MNKNSKAIIFLFLILATVAYSTQTGKINPDNIVHLSVLPQKGTDCALHALKNGHLTYSFATNPSISKFKFNALLKSPKAFPLVQWQQLLKQVGYKTTNLHQDEIEHLIPDTTIPAEHIFVFQQLEPFDINFLTSQTIYKLNKAVHQLKQASNATYVFVLSTMIDQGKFSSNGHWITITISKKDNRFTFYIADSLGKPQKYHYLVHQLTTVLNKF